MPRMPRNRKEVLEIDKKSSENGNYQVLFSFQAEAMKGLESKLFSLKIIEKILVQAEAVEMRRLETRSRREGQGLRV